MAYGLSFADACFRNIVQGGGEVGGNRDFGQKLLERSRDGEEGTDAQMLQPPELRDAGLTGARRDVPVVFR